MTTALGKLLRKWRIDKGVVMYDMAQAIGVSTSFLSAVERGKKKLSQDKMQAIREYLNLDENGYSQLKDATIKSNGEVVMNLRNQSEQDQNTMLAFARKFPTMSDIDKDTIRRFFDE